MTDIPIVEETSAEFSHGELVIDEVESSCADYPRKRRGLTRKAYNMYGQSHGYGYGYGRGGFPSSAEPEKQGEQEQGENFVEKKSFWGRIVRALSCG
jgi:hypothetical protein